MREAGSRGRARGEAGTVPQCVCVPTARHVSGPTGCRQAGRQAHMYLCIDTHYGRQARREGREKEGRDEPGATLPLCHGEWGGGNGPAFIIWEAAAQRRFSSRRHYLPTSPSRSPHSPAVTSPPSVPLPPSRSAASWLTPRASLRRTSACEATAPSGGYSRAASSARWTAAWCRAQRCGGPATTRPCYRQCYCTATATGYM